MATVILDFESRSLADLREVGGRNYWEHPTTEALCCAWFRVETGEPGIWRPGDRCPLAPGDIPVAHNAAGFDRFGAQRLGWCSATSQWIDSSAQARKAGLGGSLDALTGEKDREGSRITRELSRLPRPKSIKAKDWEGMSQSAKFSAIGGWPSIPIDIQSRVATYCLHDVSSLSERWDDLKPWLEIDSEAEAVSLKVNDIGFEFDHQLALALLECEEHNTEIAIRDAAAKLGLPPDKVRAMASSNVQFCAATGARNAQKGTVAEIEHPLAAARKALASIAKGKLIAGLNRVSPDGRLRDSLVYYGAATTGRWTGEGVQPQNVTKPSKELQSKLESLEDRAASDWLDSLAESVVSRKHIATQAEIDLLMRGCVNAKPGYTLVISDYSSVEARGLAWASGDSRALDVFRSGGDPYLVMASRIYGVPLSELSKKDPRRKLGKTAELACGYGMWADTFMQYCEAQHVELHIPASQVVNAWRELHAPAVRFWDLLMQGFMAAATGRQATIGRYTFVPSEDYGVLLFLPSGRPLVYREPAVQGYRKASYTSPRKGQDFVKGGKLAGHAIQATCRDLMAHALVRAHAAGLNPVLTIHDEIVCEVPINSEKEAACELRRIMLDLPEWAEGLPINESTTTCRRHRK